jgi:putative GTP pyrophosphokinase
MVELQIRTKLQHSWATAVETVGTFVDQSLKSSQGSEEWLQFFKLVANAFAYLENSNAIPNYEHLSRIETYNRVASEATRLQVMEQLSAFSLTVQHVNTDKRQGSFYLLTLDLDSKTVNIRTFGKSAIKEANDAYTAEETLANSDQRRQIVLVTSDSIDSLKKAYPSYFLDTNEFLRKLQQIVNISSRNNIS